jgi:hypothetical protein
MPSSLHRLAATILGASVVSIASPPWHLAAPDEQRRPLPLARGRSRPPQGLPRLRAGPQPATPRGGRGPGCRGRAAGGVPWELHQRGGPGPSWPPCVRIPGRGAVPVARAGPGSEPGQRAVGRRDDAPLAGRTDRGRGPGADWSGDGGHGPGCRRTGPSGPATSVGSWWSTRSTWAARGRSSGSSPKLGRQPDGEDERASLVAQGRLLADPGPARRGLMIDGRLTVR